MREMLLVLIDLVYSDRVIEGSPMSSISVVPIQPRPGSAAGGAATLAQTPGS